MNDILRKSILFSALGLILGLAIGIVLWLVGDPEALTAREDVHKLLTYLIVSGLYGMICMGSSVVYDIEEWSIAKATSIHFAVTLLGFYALGMIEGWLTFGDAVFLIMSIAFVVVYFVIWFIQYMSYRRMVNSMNKDLADFKSKNSNKAA